jgi:hypothetical protein
MSLTSAEDEDAADDATDGTAEELAKTEELATADELTIGNELKATVEDIPEATEIEVEREESDAAGAARAAEMDMMQ